MQLFLETWKNSPPFQDINLIYKSRISRAYKTLNSTECNSRICRFTSISSVLFRNISVLSGFVDNNSQQETEPLLIHTHNHHRICSCLPRLLFNCCFLVSWTIYLYFNLLYNFFNFYFYFNFYIPKTTNHQMKN